MSLRKYCPSRFSSRIEKGHFCFAQMSFIFLVVRFSTFFKMQQAEISHSLIFSSMSLASMGTENTLSMSFTKVNASLLLEIFYNGREEQVELILNYFSENLKILVKKSQFEDD